jgi:hypothetical protein
MFDDFDDLLPQPPDDAGVPLPIPSNKNFTFYGDAVAWSSQLTAELIIKVSWPVIPADKLNDEQKLYVQSRANNLINYLVTEGFFKQGQLKISVVTAHPPTSLGMN